MKTAALFKTITLGVLALAAGYVVYDMFAPQKAPEVKLVKIEQPGISDIEKILTHQPPAAQSSIDVQKIADEIRTEALKAFSGTKSLPLIFYTPAVGSVQSMTPEAQMRRVEQGEHLLVNWKIDPYYEVSSLTSSYESTVKRAAQLNLPLVITLEAPEKALLNDSYFTSVPDEESPVALGGDGTYGDTLSPFGPDAAWHEVGMKWAASNALKQIQQWYPNPPLVVFVSLDAPKKLAWSEAANDYRYAERYGADLDDNKLRTLIDASWHEKFRQLHTGFIDGLTRQSWQDNAKFITADQLSKSMGMQDSWMNDATLTNRTLNIWPITTDGLSIDYTLAADKPLNSNDSPHIEANNLVYMFDEAKRDNPELVSMLKLDDSGQIGSLETYEGFAQFALWFLRPDIVTKNDSLVSGNVFNSSSDDAFFNAIADAVEMIYDNDTLKDFWLNGKLMPSGKSPFDANVPNTLKNAARWYLLDSSANPATDWQTSGEVEVWAFAIEKETSTGVNKAAPRSTGNTMLFIQSANGDRSGVDVTVPGYGNINVDATQNGTFLALTGTKIVSSSSSVASSIAPVANPHVNTPADSTIATVSSTAAALSSSALQAAVSSLQSASSESSLQTDTVLASSSTAQSSTVSESASSSAASLTSSASSTPSSSSLAQSISSAEQSSAASSTAFTPPAGNIIKNWGFETADVSDYVGWGSTIYVDNGKLYVDGVGSNDNTARAASRSTLFSSNPVPGSTYVFSAEITSDVGTGQRALLFSKNSSGSSSVIGSLSSTGSTQVNIPSDSIGVEIWLRVSAGNSAWYDNVTLAPAAGARTITTTASSAQSSSSSSTIVSSASSSSASAANVQPSASYPKTPGDVGNYAKPIDTSGVVSVLDYGAKPNDSSFNNASAFQAAINDNAKVYIPAGVYYFAPGTYLSLHSKNRLIYGEGTLKTNDAFGQTARLSGVPGGREKLSNIIISGLTFENFRVFFDGIPLQNVTIQKNTFKATADYFQFVGYPYGLGICGFKLDHKDPSIEMHGVYFYNNRYIDQPRASIEILHRNFPSDARNVTYMTDIQIKGNVFTFDPKAPHTTGFNTLWCSISNGDTVNVTIEDNYSNGEGWGVELENPGRIIIKNNYFKNASPIAGYAWSVDTIIEGNYLEGHKDEYVWGKHRSIWGGGFSNAVIRNNIMIGSFEWNKGKARHSQSLLFENNTITGSVESPSHDQGILKFTDVENFTIRNNKMINGKSSGSQTPVWVSGNSTGIVEDNEAVNPNTSSFVLNLDGSSFTDINNIIK